MKLKAALILHFYLASLSFGILPLPYPIEPWETENGQSEEARDIRSIQGYAELFSEGSRREMELPTFDNPSGTLGYKSPDTFLVPPELKTRVEFWKKIYSEFTSNEAVLHDSDYPQLIYQVIDISRFTTNDSLSYRKKMKLIQRFLKAEKAKIVQQLLLLHSVRSNPLEIPVESFALFKKFEFLSADDRFLLATQRLRTQIGQRDHVVRGFLYGGRYFKVMMEIFEKKKVPKELTRLPLVESAFNLNARSKVGASGVWQFMRSTGKKFLRIDKAVDERNDPITATYAAADLLRQNYEALGSWPLAITAYNHGREGMARAVRLLATTSLPQIISRYRSRTFGFASSNFYSEFLAILEIEKEYRKYFGKLLVDPPLKYEEFKVNDDVDFDDLSSACKVEERELATLNPALTDWAISGRGFVPKGYVLRVPVGNLAKCRSGYRNVSKLPSHLTRAMLVRATRVPRSKKPADG